MSSFDTQVGGAHYKGMKMQPTEFIMMNNIPFAEGNAIKYICRHRSKHGAEDLKKAIHYIQFILEKEYNESYIFQECVRQERASHSERTNGTGEDQIGPVSNHD